MAAGGGVEREAAFAVDFAGASAEADAAGAVEEGFGGLEARGDGEGAGLIDVAPFAAPEDGGEAFAEVGSFVVEGGDDEVAGVVDEAPFAEGAGGGEAVDEGACLFELGVDEGGAGFVDVAPKLAEIHGNGIGARGGGAGGEDELIGGGDLLEHAFGAFLEAGGFVEIAIGVPDFGEIAVGGFDVVESRAGGQVEGFVGAEEVVGHAFSSIAGMAGRELVYCEVSLKRGPVAQLVRALP